MNVYIYIHIYTPQKGRTLWLDLKARHKKAPFLRGHLHLLETRLFGVIHLPARTVAVVK